ncbi:MAG TPA: cupin domain-containing protein, partial [Chitinophagales bacterium]|nr:cupin domain-containing protein [Chitinophagales bacterium]
MKRRTLIKAPLLTALVGLLPKFSAARSKQGFKVEHNKDRFNGSLHFLNGAFFLKISSKDTDGELTVYDTTRDKPGGPPLHFHHAQDEWFFVSEGEFDIRVGEETFKCKAGDSVFAPRMTPHAFANTTETGRLMVMYQPAGTMEEFFTEGSKLTDTSPPAM